MIGFTNGMNFNKMGFFFILPEISFETIPAVPNRPELKVFTFAWLFFAFHYFYGNGGVEPKPLRLVDKRLGPFFFTNMAQTCCVALPSLVIAWNTVMPNWKDGETMEQSGHIPVRQKFSVTSQFLYWAIGVGTKKEPLISKSQLEIIKHIVDNEKTSISTDKDNSE